MRPVRIRADRTPHTHEPSYFAPLPPQANYTAAALLHPRPKGHRGWTEHAPFNMALGSALGPSRPLLVDPAFRPAYLYASGDYWDYLGGRSPTLLPPAPVGDGAVPLTWCPPTTLCDDASRCKRGPSSCAAGARRSAAGAAGGGGSRSGR